MICTQWPSCMEHDNHHHDADGKVTFDPMPDPRDPPRGSDSRTSPDGSVTVTVPCDETSGTLEAIMPATAEQTTRDDSGNRPTKPAQFDDETSGELP